MALEANLSPAEIRLCCLLKLNLPSKDIAAILSISPDSLRIARYRLRKKLNLDAKANLNTFLLQV
jgi:DNA-binding CsgD family transcriptional regulator